METQAQGFYPVLPIRNTVIFPDAAFPLRVGRSFSVAAVEQAHEKHGDWILILTQSKETDGADPRPQDLYHTGALCKIERLRGSSTDGYQVLVRGVARFRVLKIEEMHEKGRSWLRADAEPWNDRVDADADTINALMESLKKVSKEILSLLPADTSQLTALLDEMMDLTTLVNVCVSNLDLPVSQKQELLETDSLKARALGLLEILQSQKDSLQIKSEIREKLSQKIGKMQREALLREQIKTIREELGEE
jgi:ATP-dependent Lon protease